MEKTVRYTLGKNERLKSRKAIEQLFADGKSFSVFPFKVVYKKNIFINEASTIKDKPETIHLQAAFSVSKKYFKKATERNRIKRLMREAYRLQKNDLQNSLQQNKMQAVVFIIYVSREIPGHILVMEKMNTILKKMQKLTNEEIAGNM